MHHPNITPTALTEQDTAVYIAMSRSFLRAARMNGNRNGRAPGPPFVKIGRAIRYLRVDLDAWLQEHRQVEHVDLPPEGSWG